MRHSIPRNYFFFFIFFFVFFSRGNRCFNHNSVLIRHGYKLFYFYKYTYSPTCIKQATKGQSKPACLRQVLAQYRYISMYLPILVSEYMLA